MSDDNEDSTMDQANIDSFAATGAAMDGEIASPALRRLLDHWKQRCSGRAMPARGDLGEDALLTALHELVLFELACAQAPAGPERPNGGPGQGMGAPFHEVMRRGQPMYRRRHEPQGGTIERLMLPLSRDGTRVDTILVGVQRRRPY